MHHASAALQAPPGHGLELLVWIQLPAIRSDYPVRRKPSLAASLRRRRKRVVTTASVRARTERAPSLVVEGGLLGIVASFAGLFLLALLGRGFEALLMKLL